MVFENKSNVLPFPALPGITAEKHSLYCLIMHDHYGAIPSGIVNEFVENDLAKVYTWDIGLGGETLPFLKLTSKGQKGAQAAYQAVRQEPDWQELLSVDMWAAKQKWPNQKFLMTHQRFKKELARSSFEDVCTDYHMDFPIT